MAPQRSYTVGRAHDCNIAIAHDSVSRTHAEVELRADGTLLVRDLGSQNGTVLLRKGREFPLTEEVVFPTDTLRFGEVAISAREVLNILKSSGEQESPPQPQLAYGSWNRYLAEIMQSVRGRPKMPPAPADEIAYPNQGKVSNRPR